MKSRREGPRFAFVQRNWRVNSRDDEPLPETRLGSEPAGQTDRDHQIRALESFQGSRDMTGGLPRPNTGPNDEARTPGDGSPDHALSRAGWSSGLQRRDDGAKLLLEGRLDQHDASPLLRSSRSQRAFL